MDHLWPSFIILIIYYQSKIINIIFDNIYEKKLEKIESNNSIGYFWPSDHAAQSAISLNIKFR